jgi:hypothetical protein
VDQEEVEDGDDEEEREEGWGDGEHGVGRAPPLPRPLQGG